MEHPLGAEQIDETLAFAGFLRELGRLEALVGEGVVPLVVEAAWTENVLVSIAASCNL